MQNEIVYFIGITIGLGWVSWISLTVISHSQKIREARDLKTGFDKMESKVTEEIKALEERLDLFIRTEIQELKSIIQKSKQ